MAARSSLNAAVARRRPHVPAAAPARPVRREGVAIGNQARLRRLRPRLEVGAVDSPLEREADAMADRVMRLAGATAVGPGGPPTIQRQCAACQAGEAGAREDAAPLVSRAVAGGGRPLDGATRAFMESRIGADFAGVRVHTDGTAARSAQSLGARAYTVGSDVVFAQGQYAPGQEAGRRLIAHELTHVVQQGGGAAGPTVQRQADDDGLSSDLNIPAFPCDHGAGMELCNTKKDGVNAPNYSDCMQNSKAIIDNCKGNMGDCLARAKCALCDCLGTNYCQCTGIV